MIARLTIALALMLAASAARAERLVVSLSNERIAVTSNYVGEDLVLFGTVQPDTGGQLKADYALVVTATGPSETLKARRKERVLGIFVNVDTREFVRVPSYLTIITDRPISQIAGPDELRRLQVGMDNYILTQRVGADFADTVTDDPFRKAFIRLKDQQHLYGQSDKAVNFLTPTVFRASIPVPANAATGRYDVDVKLFARGAMVARTATSFNVTKAGIEQYVVESSQDHGLLYGLATMSMALAIGWLASAAFRRD
ncbi:MAG: TIGR02186 family protein [Pseudolabrys sp.]